MNRRKFASLSLATCSSIALLGAAFCGPDLNAPGPGDVTGSWTAAGPAAGMTNIAMTLTQSSDGAVTGTYTATGTRNVQVCPATGPCPLSSTVAGVNDVLQVNLELRDAGTFTGQLVSSGRLRGTMTRRSSVIVEFSRATPVTTSP